MNDVTTVEPAAPAITPSVNIEGPTNARSAATLLSDWREKQARQAADSSRQSADSERQPADKSQRQRAPNGQYAAQQESPPRLEGDDAAPEVTPPSGDDAGNEPADLPPIDPPASWTKAEKDRFTALPRETQEYIAGRESEREKAVRAAQNEAAEVRKTIDERTKAADEARTRYEQAAQQTLSVLQQQQAAEFGDIRTHADVQKLANEDPFRFAQWQARQMQIQAHAQEVESLNKQRETEAKTKFDTWSKEQDDKFGKKFPEFNDPEKSPKAREMVRSALKAVGVPEDVLPKLWNEPLFRDAATQELIYYAARFLDAQAKAKSAVEAPKPQVQRPGTPASKGSSVQAEIEAATARLNKATGIAAIRAAADLQAARRKAATRR